MSKKYSGVVIPMVTPVNEHGVIDVESIGRIINSFCDAGVSPLLLGTTGEGTSVARRDGVTLIEAAAKAAAGRLTIYAAVSGGKMQDLIEDAAAYHAAGASVITATIPSYYTLNDVQIEKFYDALSDAVPAPFMLYNIKKTTGMSIPLETVERLSHKDNVVGIKDSENDLERMEKCIAIARGREDFSYFSGCAANSMAALLQGADGIVPSSGNYDPFLYRELYNQASSQVTASPEAVSPAASVKQLQLRSDALGSVYQAGNTLGESLAALKLIMGTKGLCGLSMLSPLTRLDAAREAQILDKLKSYETR